MAGAEQHKVREYLLGRLPEAEAEQVELRLLTDPEFAEEFDITVNEITDDYVAGKFSGNDLEQVEEYFFKATQRRGKLKFALALKKRIGPKTSFRPYLAIAASLALALGGFYIWRTLNTQAELNKGLAALQAAFDQERPLEARLSDFPYAPLANKRGGPTRIDYVQRDRAASLLLNAVSEHPSAASHHGLGKYYLAESQFDKAIDQFQNALKLDPNNAKVLSDLGAALLEQGKIDRNSTDTEKGIDELRRSLQNLNKALTLNPNLPEAIFNRALCRQYLDQPNDAAADWRLYLKYDGSSPWAIEANQALKNLEQKNLLLPN